MLFYLFLFCIQMCLLTYYFSWQIIQYIILILFLNLITFILRLLFYKFLILQFFLYVVFKPRGF